MSYIKETLQCDNCKIYFNVVTGTFGTGVPTTCACGAFSHQFKFIDYGFRANFDGTLGPEEGLTWQSEQ